MTIGNDQYDQLCNHLRDTATLRSVVGLLGWDERTFLPAAAAEHRATQMTMLPGMLHQRKTDPRIGDWLDALSDSDLAHKPHSDNRECCIRLALSRLRQIIGEQLFENPDIVNAIKAEIAMLGSYAVE